MIRGIHHVSLTTQHLDAMVEFYRDVLGFEEIMRANWENLPVADLIVGMKNSVATGILLKAGAIILELFEHSNPPGKPENKNRRLNDAGIAHICLDVVDIDSEYERLKAAGMEFINPPQAVFFVKTTFGRDPDGNLIELQEILADHPIAIY